MVRESSLGGNRVYRKLNPTLRDKIFLQSREIDIANANAKAQAVYDGWLKEQQKDIDRLIPKTNGYTDRLLALRDALIETGGRAKGLSAEWLSFIAAMAASTERMAAFKAGLDSMDAALLPHAGKVNALANEYRGFVDVLTESTIARAEADQRLLNATLAVGPPPIGAQIEAAMIDFRIKQKEAIERLRDDISNFAFDVGGVFGGAVDRWKGSFRDFFQSIGRGFADLCRRIVGDFLQSQIHSLLRNFLEGIFGVRSGGGPLSATIFGRGTPGFAGGPGAGGLPSSQLSLAGVLGAIPTGTITAPPSLSGTQASQQAIQQAIQAAQGTTGTAGGFGGGFAGLGAAAPLLGLFAGAGLGGMAGGSSTLGRILGTIGGAGIGVVAGSAIPSILAGSFAGLTALGFATLGIGGALLVGAILLGRASTRRREEQQRDQLREEAYAQLTQLLELAKRGQLDPATAGIQAQSIVDSYYQQIAQFRTASVRRSAENFRPFFNQRVQAIVEAAKGAERRQQIASQLIPEFQHGGLVPFRSNALTLIKVRPQEKLFFPSGSSARVPGIDRGVDSVYTYAPPGTSVVPPNVPSFANGGTVGAGPGTVEVTINLRQDLKEIVVESIKTSDGRKAVVKAVRVGRRDGEFN